MATQTLPLSQPVRNRSAVLCTLARQKAIKAIKEQLRAQGLRPSQFSAREIHIRADGYFETHRQRLIEEAIETVSKCPELRKFYEREQRQLCSKLTSSAQTKPRCNDERNSVQMLCAKVVGYARVSTDGQSLEAQQQALREAGCTTIFSEKESGAKSDRFQLARAIASLGQGDTLVVCKLDRLARSTRDLLNTLDAIGKAGAAFRSLTDTWANTDTRQS